MKKHLRIFLLLCIFLFPLWLSAYQVTVSGQIKDNVNGMPVSNHTVYITSDTSVNSSFNYADSTQTNMFGVFTFIISVQQNFGGVIVSTNDCNAISNDTSMIFSPNFTVLLASFNICDTANSGNCQAYYTVQPLFQQLFSYQFTDYSFGNIIYSIWDFGDGNLAQTPNPIHTYSSGGKYRVCLSVYDSLGCYDVYCDSINVDTVYFPGCEADFSYAQDTTINTPNYYHFNDLSTGSNIISWHWDFGDGNTSFLQNPDHQYTLGGNYQVKLTILSYDLATGLACNDSFQQNLLAAPLNHYHLGGHQYAGTYPANEGRAYLYRKVNNMYKADDSLYFDTLGYYYFYQKMQSDYLVQTFPGDSAKANYFPTYYGDALYWQDATPISLNQNMFNADIHLNGKSGYTSGNHTIKGYVVWGNSIPAGLNDFVDDAVVIISDASQNALDYTMSAITGYFEFENVANGHYFINADYTSYYSSMEEVYFSSSSPQVSDTLFIVINPLPYTAIDNNESHKREAFIFPNPVQDKLYIKSSGINGIAHIRIMDISGTMVWEEERAVFYPGELHSIECRNLAPGMYILSIYADEDQGYIMKKFIKY